MYRTLLGLGCCVIAWLVPCVALAAPLSAQDVVSYALLHHPDAVTSQAAIDVAAADRRQAAVLLWNPDVEATVGISGSSEIKVAQPFSLTGEGYSARREATLRGQAAALAKHRADLVLATDARLAWIEAAAASRRASVAEDALKQARQLNAATTARATQGEASDLDLRMARLAEAQALSDALSARRAEADARTALAAFHPDAMSAELGDPLDAVPAGTGSDAERSDLASARRDVDAAKAELARQRSAVVDPISLGATLDVGGGPASAGPYVAWTVPLWTRNQGEVARSRAELALRQAQVAQLQQVVQADQSTSDAVAASARSDFDRLGDADADARAALAAVESGVRSGELDLSTAALLRAQILDGWMSAIDARAATANALISSLLSHDDSALLGGAP